MKHTPGPWEIKSGIAIYAGKRWIASCARTNDWMTESERQANARLIAAAPDLLIHLSRMIEHLAVAADDGAYDAEIEAAQAVITKAKGG